ncbi:hypothetical protein V1517DRAFT_66556 [Lipomyces orientalis]|uniref:Uncharacterized protein n=1 Tax=Lipomyces orientalis TaxID=1233043 RepID=A0ACC3TEQ4_9ASCO
MEMIGSVEFSPLDIAGYQYKVVSASNSNSNRDLDAMIIFWTLDKHGKNTSKQTDPIDIEGLATTATEEAMRTLVSSHG